MSVKIVVPELGESIVEATVGRWLKQAGDPVAVGDILVSLETDKVDVEVGAEKSGVLARIEAEEGQDVKIGDVLAVIEEGEPAAATEVPTAETEKPEESEAAEEPRPAEAPEQAAEPRPAEPPVEAPAADGQKERSGPERVTPVARRMAEDQGLDLAGVQGSGPGGRITKQDVAGRARQQEAAPPPPATPATAAPSGETAPAEERVRMSRRRRTIAARLVEAQRTAAMLTTFNEVDMGAVIDLRKRRQEEFRARHDVKLGFMSFFVKAAVSALREFPRLNAEIDGDEIVLKRYYNIGMAVGAEEGLVVPVLRDAGRMSFAEIEQQLRDYVKKVQAGSLALDDLRGGTFTITNGGVFGSLLSTPILNPPEVAILGLHKIEERPVAVDGEVVVRPMMYLALSYDHRLVDGREAVQFLVRIKEFIEDPGRLLLEA